ncbi:hypothetical protein WV34_03335 [Bacillus amyloliquefaciens]|nr:hypothetical protein WV34_03335 [Bacillus amyloliquefaciens]
MRNITNLAEEKRLFLSLVNILVSFFIYEYLFRIRTILNRKKPLMQMTSPREVFLSMLLFVQRIR